MIEKKCGYEKCKNTVIGTKENFCSKECGDKEHARISAERQKQKA